MAVYPSQGWCDEWKEAINNDSRVAETGKNWGVGFNGNWLFIVTPGDGLVETVYVYLEAAAGHAGHTTHLSPRLGSALDERWHCRLVLASG